MTDITVINRHLIFPDATMDILLKPKKEQHERT